MLCPTLSSPIVDLKPNQNPMPMLEEIYTDGAWRLKDFFGKKRCRNKCMPIYIDSSD